jgi:hypothetical protein
MTPSLTLLPALAAVHSDSALAGLLSATLLPLKSRTTTS